MTENPCQTATYRLSCRTVMLCNIQCAYAAYANAVGLIDYSLYSVHLQYPQNDCLRYGGLDQPLSLLTQSFHFMDRYTMKSVYQALENKDTCIVHTLSYCPKWCLSI